MDNNLQAFSAFCFSTMHITTNATQKTVQINVFTSFTIAIAFQPPTTPISYGLANNIHKWGNYVTNYRRGNIRSQLKPLIEQQVNFNQKEKFDAANGLLKFKALSRFKSRQWFHRTIECLTSTNLAATIYVKTRRTAIAMTFDCNQPAAIFQL